MHCDKDGNATKVFGCGVLSAMVVVIGSVLEEEEEEEGFRTQRNRFNNVYSARTSAWRSRDFSMFVTLGLSGGIMGPEFF